MINHKKLLVMLMIISHQYMIARDAALLDIESFELESDENGNNSNLQIPNIGGQMSETPTAFDKFDQEDSIHSVDRGVQDDLDVAIISDNSYCFVDNSREDSPLMIDILQQDFTAMKKLLQDGNCDVNYQNKDGQTALHYAAQLGKIKFIYLLLQYGAQVNVVDYIGRTPLHIACQNDNSATARLLMHHGADTTILDNDDKIAEDYAVSSGMKKVFQTQPISI